MMREVGGARRSLNTEDDSRERREKPRRVTVDFRGLPAPGAPFFEVRALRAERGVAAVAREDPGRVGQPAEYL
jgi:hypothetical protein